MGFSFSARGKVAGMIDLLSDTLRKGEVVVVPTDTVYGLVCDGRSDSAKEKIFHLKGRSFSKTLIGFVRDIDSAKNFGMIADRFSSFVRKRWPGRSTFVLPAKTSLKYLVTETDTIALRVPDFLLLRELNNRFDILASTSANISGGKSATSFSELPAKLLSQVSLAVDGEKRGGKVSAIWDLIEKEARLQRGNLLFVCSGNSCRSPMAEACLNHILSRSEITVSSAGMNAVNGTKPSIAALQVLREAGLSLPNFSSRRLTREILEESDLVFTMDSFQKRSLLSRAPCLEGAVVSLHISDPLGCDIGYYRRTLENITDAIYRSVLTRIVQ
jgi:tRNA threonylcarbamoyl adenosine modification protein (Sua5/YciO/YrdC/YwlC family)